MTTGVPVEPFGAGTGLDFWDLLNVLADHLGYPQPPTNGEDLRRCVSVIQAAYEKVLMPPPFGGTAVSHRWYFLTPLLELQAKEGDWQIDLPPDFGHLVGHELFYPQGTYAKSLRLTNPGIVLGRREGMERTGYPEFAAICPKRLQGQVGQRFQLLLWPTPHTDITLVGTYRIHHRPLWNPLCTGNGEMVQIGEEEDYRGLEDTNQDFTLNAVAAYDRVAIFSASGDIEGLHTVAGIEADNTVALTVGVDADYSVSQYAVLPRHIYAAGGDVLRDALREMTLWVAADWYESDPTEIARRKTQALEALSAAIAEDSTRAPAYLGRNLDRGETDDQQDRHPFTSVTYGS